MLLIWVGISVQGLAQEYDFKIYSVNEGLPQGQVHDITQTSDGFMWMATNGGGLTRFDGDKFKTYTTEDGLKNNAVQNIYEDSQGRFWVANYPAGVVRFQGDSLVNPFPDDSLSKFEVWQINELNDGEVWFGTYDGGIFILENGELRRITTQDGLISNKVWDIKQFGNDTIWITTQDGISILKDGEFTNYSTEDGLSGQKVYQVTEDQKGNKWFATSNGITIWNGEDFQSIREIKGINLGYVFDVKAAANGHIWIGTETKGVFVYDGESYIHLTRENGLSSNYIYSFYEDANNNMWIATDENGVNLYRGDAFVFYGKSFGFSSDEVLSVYFDREGKLWLGTTEGINSYNGTTIRQYRLPGEYENNYIWEIEELPNSNQLFLMPDNTLMEYDGQQFHNFTAEKGLEKWYIYDLFVDSNNVLWIATDEGVFRLEDEKLRQFTTDDGMVGNIVQHVYESGDGNLYFATTAGLSIYDGNSFTNLTINDGLAHSTINFVTEDSKDNIWLGTAGGVSVLKKGQNGNTFTIANFDKKHGMGMLDTHFIWFDKMGYLWQATNGGLNRLNVPEYWESGSMDLMHYALTDKSMGVEFNFKAVTTDSANNAWFGSMNGAMKLDVSKLDISTRNNPPKVHLTGIKRNSKPVEWNDFTTDLNYQNGSLIYPSVTFPHGEHTYTFSFSSMEYQRPENVEYRYRMKGFEKGWVPFTSDNSATYTNLEPGNYTFIVQAASGSHKELSASTAYSFSVAFPFWQTYWFYALVVLGLAGLIYGYIRIRLGMIEKQRLQELVDYKTKDLQKALDEKEVLIKEIHHRVKNNLAVVSGLLELQMGSSNDEYIVRTLSESQRRVQSIAMVHEKLYQNEDLSEIDFQKYVTELLDIIAYSINKDDRDIELKSHIDQIDLGIDQAIPCGLILNELVSNAYEHAFKGRNSGTIWVDFFEDNNEIQINIADNGKGMPEDIEVEKLDSLGLTLVDTLVQQLEGDLTLVSSGEGTKYIIEFEKESVNSDLPA